jgi:hypothetical protein
LEEKVIFPLAEGDESKVGEVIGGKKVQEKVAGALPIVGPAEYFEGVDKTPGVGVNLRRSNIKSVENFDLEGRERKAKTNQTKEAVIDHKEVGTSLAGTGPNPFIRIHTFRLVQGDWT